MIASSAQVEIIIDSSRIGHCGGAVRASAALVTHRRRTHRAVRGCSSPTFEGRSRRRTPGDADGPGQRQRLRDVRHTRPRRTKGVPAGRLVASVRRGEAHDGEGVRAPSLCRRKCRCTRLSLPAPRLALPLALLFRIRGFIHLLTRLSVVVRA